VDVGEVMVVILEESGRPKTKKPPGLPAVSGRFGYQLS